VSLATKSKFQQRALRDREVYRWVVDMIEEHENGQVYDFEALDLQDGDVID
jgi:hypothetical protein